ncbi:MAG: flagellin [Candidatus Nitricoxidivorans perseverans]|uniref:Flagellin n=1 Tax=Candidatus Nitricoxidivorans perseverans TaxID=2975601 RepID=A0AA49FMV2_9PROT|nr:MAG: flagellin [Candidatus Nitricoxidivorans perseverans]
MAQVINTNIQSLNAQRNLNTSQSALSVSLQRLSSGLRINSAKDDAAGMAIASRMTAQVRGLNQAARNANDGISLAQTAEGALGEISNNLQRIRELAIQSANSTNSASDRASLDAESTQLIAEITRVASQTSFNGLNLLDGTFTSQAFQVGANANQTISVNSIADARATGLGSNILVAGGTLMGTTKAAAADLTGGNTVAVEAGLTVTTVNGGTTAAFGYAALADAKAIAAAINTNAASVGVTATASNSATLSSVSVAGTYTFTLGGTSTAAISASITDTTDLTNLVGAINGAAGTTGITATFTSTSAKNSITLTSSDGSDISILDINRTEGDTGTVAFSGVTLSTVAAATADSSIKIGSVSLASTKGAITLAGHNADVFNTANSTFSSMASVSLTSAANAQLAIATVDAALGMVNVSRGDLGAYQNRFSSAIANLQTNSENVAAARSRIEDADFAQETAALTRNQILQQAGIAMLAQANALPQNVLTLLRG